MVLNILSGDIQIADRMVRIPTDAELYAMDKIALDKHKKLIDLFYKTIDSQGVELGGKAKIDYTAFRAFCTATAGLEGKTSPGGSAGNTLVTLSRLLNAGKTRQINVDMFGVVGAGDPYSERIRADLEREKINLIPPESEYTRLPQAATSFVFQHPPGPDGEKGKRTIVTYPGNAKDILKPEMVTPELINKNDVVFLQGSAWEKFDRPFPDALMQLRYGKGKEMWLALPTHAKFRPDMMAEDYRYLIPCADVVLANDDELKRIYEINDLGRALHLLQADINKRDEMLESQGKPPHSNPPVAFVTCGKHGAVVVTPDVITPVDPPDISKHEKIYTLGAGDNAYAGFLAGHVAKLDPIESGKLGMQLAGAKLAFDDARMPDPGDALTRFSNMGAQLLRTVACNLT